MSNTESNKPLYLKLNEERTQGEWNNNLNDGQILDSGNNPVGNFYGALKKCTEYWPETDSPCLRLKGFKVLQHDGFTELTPDNMGATVCDDGKPYFYSAEWAKAGKPTNRIVGSLPVLTAFERQGQYGAPFDLQIKRTYQIVLTVWDKYTEKKDGKCVGPESRVVNEIYRDTEQMLIWVLKYAGRLLLATTDTVPTPMLYNQDWLDQAKARGYITTYAVNGSLKNTLQPQGSPSSPGPAPTTSLKPQRNPRNCLTAFR